MPEPGTIPLDVPGGVQLENSYSNDKKAVASVASCAIRKQVSTDQVTNGRGGERYRGRGSR